MSTCSRFDDLATGYDRNYAQPNFFNYRSWVYRPFIRALMKKAGIKEKSRLLDAGCGQGFFTSLFAEYGVKALGVDMSAVGIAQARKDFGSLADFEVADVLSLQYENQFDCVYSRSCSLYNRDDFVEDRSVSDALLRYVKPGGVLIFDYYSNQCARKRSEKWIYHSLASTKMHFGNYPGASIFFSLRVDTLLLGSLSFSLSGLNVFTSRITGIGGDLVAVVPKA